MAVHPFRESRSTTETLPFVKDFDPETRLALMEGSTTEIFEKGDNILQVGEAPQSLGIVVSGMVELCGTERNAECGVLLLTHGDLIYPMAHAPRGALPDFGDRFDPKQDPDVGTAAGYRTGKLAVRSGHGPRTGHRCPVQDGGPAHHRP
jgi:hypothetical protein